MSNNKVHCINFGYYSRTITIGFTGGVKVFSIDGLAVLELLYESTYDYSDVHSAECIGHVVSLVQFRCPRQFIQYNFDDKTEINKTEFNENIITFKINKTLILVRLPTSLHILDAHTYESTHVLSDLDIFSTALALCMTFSPKLFAYPSMPEVGSVTIRKVTEDVDLVSYDLFQESVHVVKPFDKQISQIEFNSHGDMLAIASVEGTFIYVVKVNGGDILYQFLRGISKHVSISSLFFANGNYLVCSSDSDTVHVFEMSLNVSVVGSYITSAVSYLPFGSSFIMKRSSIGAKIPTGGFPTKSYYWKHGGLGWLAVACKSGTLHVFVVDVPCGQCILIPTQCNLLKIGRYHVTINHEDEGSYVLTDMHSLSNENSPSIEDISSVVSSENPKEDIKNNNHVKLCLDSSSSD